METPFWAPTRSGSPFLVYHICKICRNPRSKTYHIRHPIQGNVMPEPDICTACKAQSTEPVVVQAPESATQNFIARRHIPFRHVEAPIAAIAPGSSHAVQQLSSRRLVPFRHIEAPLATTPSTVTPQSSISQQSPSDRNSTASYRATYPAMDSVAIQRQRMHKPDVAFAPVSSLLPAPHYEPANAQLLTRTFKEPPSRARKSVRVEVPTAAHGPFHAEVSPTPSMEVLTTGSQMGDDGQQHGPMQPGWLRVTKTKQYIDTRGRPFEITEEGIVLEKGSRFKP